MSPQRLPCSQADTDSRCWPSHWPEGSPPSGGCPRRPEAYQTTRWRSGHWFSAASCWLERCVSFRLLLLVQLSSSYSNEKSVTCLLGDRVEPIADPRFGLDELWIFRVRFDLLAQVYHNYPKIIDLVAIVRPPYGLQEFSMRNCMICMLCQVPKDVEFLWREV